MNRSLRTRCPLEVEVLEAFCRPEPNTVWAHYAVRNVGTKQIQGYQIRTSERYERYRSDSQGYGAERLEFAPGGQVDDWATCCGRVEGTGGDPGRFTALVLMVTEVQFADGTVWRRPETAKGSSK